MMSKKCLSLCLLCLGVVWSGCDTWPKLWSDGFEVGGALSVETRMRALGADRQVLPTVPGPDGRPLVEVDQFDTFFCEIWADGHDLAELLELGKIFLWRVSIPGETGQPFEERGALFDVSFDEPGLKRISVKVSEVHGVAYLVSTAYDSIWVKVRPKIPPAPIPSPETRFFVETDVDGPGKITRDLPQPNNGYLNDTKVTFTAVPLTDKDRFDGWSGSLDETANPLTVEVNANLRLKAHFSHVETPPAPQPTYYQLYLNSTTGGTAAASPTGPYLAGSQVTLTATPDASNYRFDSWSGDVEGTQNPKTITMDTTKTATANFVRRTVTIRASATFGGDINPSGNVSVIVGNNQTFTITNDEGAQIREVKVDGVSVGAVSSYTFQNVRQDHSIEAIFEAAPDNRVDCVMSAWSAWTPDGDWSTCVNGHQTRPEKRTRTVVTPAQNGGAACPYDTETRTVSRDCTVDPGPLVAWIESPANGSQHYLDEEILFRAGVRGGTGLYIYHWLLPPGVNIYLTDDPDFPYTFESTDEDLTSEGIQNGGVALQVEDVATGEKSEIVAITIDVDPLP